MSTLTDDELRNLLASATPGPWATFNATDVFPDDSDTTAKCQIADCDMSAELNTHEIITNARLIAAAPDLAAEVLALRNVICEIAISANDDDGFTGDGHERCVDRATAAYRATVLS